MPLDRSCYAMGQYLRYVSDEELVTELRRRGLRDQELTAEAILEWFDDELVFHPDRKIPTSFEKELREMLLGLQREAKVNKGCRPLKET